MKTISKKEIIVALGEKTTALNQKKDELVEELFEIQCLAEKQIKRLNSEGIIDISEWGISFLQRKYNDYMMYEGCIIDKFGGRYDGGDFNEWVPETNYKKLIEFCEKADAIIAGMQEAFEEKIASIKANVEK